MRAHSRLLTSLTGVVLLAAATLIACGHPATSQPTGATTPKPTSAHPAPSSRPSSPSGAISPAPSAADQLAGFVAAAQRADTQIRHAAASINGCIDRTSMRFPKATLDAIHAIDIASPVRAIPAGLPQDLLRDVLNVYADLASRNASLNGILLYDYDGHTLPLKGADGQGILRCLSHGAPAAARFSADLTAMLTLARQISPVTPASPQSRAAAELAVQVELIRGPNFCSYECGGYVPTQFYVLTFAPETRPDHYEGTFGSGGRFWADYHPGQGWEVGINAC